MPTPDSADKPIATEDLFKHLGLEKLSDKEKLDLSEDLGEVALNRISNRLGAMLTPEQALEFEAMLRNDEAGAFELLEKYIPDYSSIVQEEIVALKGEIVDTHNSVMKKLNY